jgi:hypothetical protein
MAGGAKQAKDFVFILETDQIKAEKYRYQESECSHTFSVVFIFLLTK